MIAHRRAEHSDVTRGPQRSILLVEDDEVVATLIVELLGELGEVHWTASAEQASEIVSGRDWDLMVCDIDLPGIDGLELVRRVKRAAPEAGDADPVRPQLVRSRRRGACAPAPTTT